MRRPTAQRILTVLGGGALMVGLGVSSLPLLRGALAAARGASPFPPPPGGPGSLPLETDGPPPPGVVPDDPGAGTLLSLLPSDPSLPLAPDGRHYPLVPTDSSALATLLVRVEEALRDPGTPQAALPALGHQQQVIYRLLSHRPSFSDQVRTSLPERWRSTYDRHLAARREFLAMHRGGRKPTSLPAWRIVAPEPAEKLISHYKKAEAATGIEWEVLAAVNLVETGMGRIDGVSVANAQGPMQFLPTTWTEPGIGQGDIRDPHDAIQAAARYLVRRGGLKDIRKGLWGYNNSDHYGRAVLHYASLIREDPRAYIGLYHWEIHFGTEAGDLWLPVGYNQSDRIAVATYLQQQPASAPPPGSSGW